MNNHFFQRKDDTDKLRTPIDIIDDLKIVVTN